VPQGFERLMKLGKSAVIFALYAITAMYLFFMILDRVLSLIFGFNFQPYGSYFPPGFTLWGHFANGTMAISGTWIMLKVWDFVGGSKYQVILRAADLLLAISISLWIPYNNDAAYLISRGHGDVIPLYVVANAIYVLGAGVITLRFVASDKWRLVLLAVLLVAFLTVHFVFYAPMFPEFRWT